jgi:chemotaxis protein methyltransferase CheR
MSSTAPATRQTAATTEGTHLPVGLQRGCDLDISTETFDEIGRILRERSGFCLEGYKDKCVKRRINIRVRATQCTCAETYCTLLAGNEAEQDHLLRVLTIHVSHFFRNPSTFEKISGEILPELLAGRAPENIRLMSVGCAGGEEPYSLALIVREQFARELAAGRVRIDATDVDPTTIEGAKKALYYPDRLAEVSPELLSRWFTPEGGRFRLHEEICSLVHFGHADLNSLEPIERCDLILCRNVLIYFERKRQEVILNGFADALQSGGILVLGKSESLFGAARARFRTVCPVERIYRVI